MTSVAIKVLAATFVPAILLIFAGCSGKSGSDEPACTRQFQCTAGCTICEDSKCVYQCDDTESCNQEDACQSSSQTNCTTSSDCIGDEECYNTTFKYSDKVLDTGTCFLPCTADGGACKEIQLCSEDSGLCYTKKILVAGFPIGSNWQAQAPLPLMELDCCPKPKELNTLPNTLDECSMPEDQNVNVFVAPTQFDNVTIPIDPNDCDLYTVMNQGLRAPPSYDSDFLTYIGELYEGKVCGFIPAIRFANATNSTTPKKGDRVRFLEDIGAARPNDIGSYQGLENDRTIFTIEAGVNNGKKVTAPQFPFPDSITILAPTCYSRRISGMPRACPPAKRGQGLMTCDQYAATGMHNLINDNIPAVTSSDLMKVQMWVIGHSLGGKTMLDGLAKKKATWESRDLTHAIMLEGGAYPNKTDFADKLQRATKYNPSAQLIVVTGGKSEQSRWWRSNEIKDIVMKNWKPANVQKNAVVFATDVKWKHAEVQNGDKTKAIVESVLNAIASNPTVSGVAGVAAAFPITLATIFATGRLAATNSSDSLFGNGKTSGDDTSVHPFVVGNTFLLKESLTYANITIGGGITIYSSLANGTRDTASAKNITESEFNTLVGSKIFTLTETSMPDLDPEDCEDPEDAVKCTVIVKGSFGTDVFYFQIKKFWLDVLYQFKKDLTWNGTYSSITWGAPDGNGAIDTTSFFPFTLTVDHFGYLVNSGTGATKFILVRDDSDGWLIVKPTRSTMFPYWRVKRDWLDFYVHPTLYQFKQPNSLTYANYTAGGNIQLFTANRDNVDSPGFVGTVPSGRNTMHSEQCLPNPSLNHFMYGITFLVGGSKVHTD
eukprot:gene877-101_t